eukprot:CAMPEP_0179001060 /NCGR_PEP_ID=MMETSP0795-20121207/11089_1 /TAXON_ID=88552 /ORGANISM="Amoebophrya sp., Strain Ameob2" /LENGTH=124 /DNA_ID=CAMNT_0020694269 /DNA_START=109 /DNA_END=484 /DNA_ORIENTATION=+
MKKGALRAVRGRMRSIEWRASSRAIDANTTWEEEMGEGPRTLAAMVQLVAMTGNEATADWEWDSKRSLVLARTARPRPVCSGIVLEERSAGIVFQLFLARGGTSALDSHIAKVLMNPNLILRPK